MSPIVVSNPNATSFIIPIKLNVGNKSVETKALIDSGAEGMFINSKLIDEKGFKTLPLSCPITAKNVDNTINKQSLITRFTRQIFSIGEKRYLDQFLVTNTGNTPVILGLP